MDNISLEKSHMLTQSLWRSEQIRALEKVGAEQAGISLFELMTRAGAAVFNQARVTWPKASRWWIFTGGGNNAGDGYIVARLALEAGIEVRVIQLGDAQRLTGDAAKARDLYLAKGTLLYSLAEFSALFANKHTGNSAQVPSHMASELIIDALLGTGVKGPLRGEFEHHIQAINQSALPVLAIDVPSGLCANSGHIFTCAVAAELTLCVMGLKLGLLTGRGPDVVGRLLLADLGIAPNLSLQTPAKGSLAPLQPVAQLMHWSEWRAHLPQRRPSAHKGEAGRVLVAGGNLGMSGAIRLAGEAALRTGAGLVRLLSHKEHQASLNISRPELMTAHFSAVNDWAWASVLVLGPGLGRDEWAQALFEEAIVATAPLVIDADALWWLAKASPETLPEPSARRWVLTPHSGEAARLLRCSVAEVEADRLAAVRAIQQQYGAVVVLKGAGSLIADEQQVRLCHYGNNGMASGGMGDVLSGIIGALLAQGAAPMTAASLAVCVHALAGDKAAKSGKLGLLAADLFLPLRSLINKDDEYDDT